MVGDWRVALMEVSAAPTALGASEVSHVAPAGVPPTAAPHPALMAGGNASHAENRRAIEVGLQLLQSENPGAFHVDAEISDDKSSTTQSSLSDAVMELVELMKNNTTQNDPLQINFAQLDDSENFAGNVALNTFHTKLEADEWIVDSGATNHISGNLELFSTFSVPDKMVQISLPDGNPPYPLVPVTNDQGEDLQPCLDSGQVRGCNPLPAAAQGKNLSPVVASVLDPGSSPQTDSTEVVRRSTRARV
ncbi:hypothetical protein Salat_0922100 [Sesamum alatum]|uniref:Uncharacterized protein n=1 Tax=Sesamum alatum TaxID=300844 RepID=A0AAE2CR97_9LAMI|nr:hypothetical protein Salat_0922100 [Sesamum alatum]